MLADIALIGVGVMGENLILNMLNHGFSVSCFDIKHENVKEFVNGRAKGKKVIGCYSLEELLANTSKPRKIMVMIRAGEPVDNLLNSLKPLLSKGDIVIDGGNSHFPDTIRRVKEMEDLGFYYLGMGVSGGEEGALNGPSLMPGGSIQAWEKVKDIYQAIAAKTDDGEACCDYVGENGAGHFVKMVHNGIEYGDMQLICEIYDIMRKLLKMPAQEMHKVFANWNKGDLNSYLIEITSNILNYLDEDNLPLVEKILDTAGQKGTGKWTGIASLDEGVPLTLITEAVYARCLSSMKDERVKAAEVFNKDIKAFSGDKLELINKMEKALYVAKIISYAQGYTLMRSAAKTYNWNLNYGGIALMWRGGCIIRSQFLGKIKEAYTKNPNLNNLLLDDYFKKIIDENIKHLRDVVVIAMQNGVAIPSLASALNYFDAYIDKSSPANLLQAQRDYFGAHTYERIDRNRGEYFHTDWTGHGGKKASTTYNE